MIKVGFALTASYCTIPKILPELQKLVELGYDVIPIASPSVFKENTRFGEAMALRAIVCSMTNRAVTTIGEAELFGSKEPLDIIVVAPATGNTIAKIANGITDTVTTMAVKATRRNLRPVVISISTNDGLGLNGPNIMHLLDTKDVYFVPFGQDNPEKKPTSLMAHEDLIVPTIEAALNGKQMQPVLKDWQKIMK